MNFPANRKRKGGIAHLLPFECFLPNMTTHDPQSHYQHIEG
ncbi:hypothetical protein BOVA208_3965 [Bacteroides ovatus]|nr:hypothetical protein BOVA208_3965 [Bacteroides ovatus]